MDTQLIGKIDSSSILYKLNNTADVQDLHSCRYTPMQGKALLLHFLTKNVESK